MQSSSEQRIAWHLPIDLCMVDCAGFFGFSRNSLDQSADEDNDILGWYRSYMHAILSNLMAVTLLVHALQGCCWQYAHGCVQCVKPVSKATACCKHHHAKCQQKQAPCVPCKCKLQCQGVCTYLPQQKTQFDRPQPAIQHDFAVVIPVLAGCKVVSESVSGRNHAAGPLKLPVRLHLLHQILLI